MSPHVLIADDEPLIRSTLRATLMRESYDVTAAASGAEAWAAFTTDRPDLVLLDLVLGDTYGIPLLQRMRAENPDTKILLMTAHGSIETAVQAMKLGAYDFIKKPFELEEVMAAVRNALRTSSLERRVAYLADRQRKEADPNTLVHCSPEMGRVLEELRVVAANPVPVVLILGESGTGKQVLARMLHDQSPRASGPFVELNCSTIPENLVESELFGHERGAFSDARDRKPGLVEVADGGTLFLDEIGDLSAAAQAKLLTFLEQRTFRRLGATSSRRVDVRIAAATNRDLQAMVAARTFREDLWYRLSAIVLRIPPLRERHGDVAALAEHFLRESSREFHRRWRELAPETTALLERYAWPGNVRELRAVVGRAALLHDEQILQPEHLSSEILAATVQRSDARPSASAGGPIPSLAEVEMAHIRRVLELCGGNRTQAAERLGITRQTLTRRLGESERE